MPTSKTPPVATTTTVSSVCPKCGIAKSGKSSCCGRGGSWHTSCGSAYNTRLQHTWYEGLHACKAWARSRIAVGRQNDAAQQKRVITAAKPFAFWAVNTSTSMAKPTSITMTNSRLSTADGILTTNSKIAGVAVTAIYMSDNMSISTSSITSINMSTSTPIIPPASTSVTMQGCEKLMKIVFHINLLIIMLFQP